MLKPTKIVILLLIVFNMTLYSKSININFKDLDISKLIEITSRTIGKSILTTENINGRVNFSSTKALNQNELLELLILTLNSKGYSLEKKKNIFRIIKKDQYQTKIIKLKHSDAKDVIEILKTLISKNEPTKISVIKDLNAIFILSNSNKIEKLKHMIIKLDQPKMQVYVKARIIEVNNSLINNIGIRYGIFGNKSTTSELFTFSSNLNNSNSNQVSFSSSDIDLSLNSINSVLALGATINLLKQNHALNIVSEPSILCLNNKESSIYVGEKKSIKTASTLTDSGTSKDTFTRENIGLTLKVKPRVSSDNRVLLELQTILENFSETNSTNNQPDTFKKEINTTAIVHNGESVIIGGLTEDKSEKVNNDVPFISDIPLLGNLFKDTNSINIKKNLVVIITPYIVSNTESLTTLRNKLAKLQFLEDSYLEQSLKILEQKKQKSKKRDEKPINEKKAENLHQQRVKEYFGI